MELKIEDNVMRGQAVNICIQLYPESALSEDGEAQFIEQVFAWMAKLERLKIEHVKRKIAMENFVTKENDKQLEDNMMKVLKQ